jgi:hypothetical protein
MHGKFIQISAVASPGAELIVYALDINGKIWQNLPGINNSKWIKLND